MKTPTQTTKPGRARRTARESLIRLVTDYAPVVPFFAALLATQPTPKLPRPARRRARRGGDPGAGGGTGDGGESR